MLTLEKIKEFIRLHKVPCWNLQIVQGGSFSRPVPVAAYAPEKKKAADDEPADNSDIDGSIAQLENTLKFYEGENCYFKIILKPTKNANQGSVYGPLDFNLTGETPAGTKGLAGVPQQGAMSGLAGVAELLGVVNQLNQGPEQKLAQLAAKEESLSTAKEAFQLEKIKLAIDQKDLENQKEKLKEDRKKFEDEIKEAKDKYEKRKNQVGDLADEAIGRIINKFLSDDEKATLAGTKTETQEEPASEEQKLVESIAANIYDNVKDKAEITKIGIVVQHLINRPELYDTFIELAKDEA